MPEEKKENEEPQKVRKTRKSKRRDKYIEARINGASQSKAREIAGYHPEYRGELVNSPTRHKIIEELKKRGIDETFVAGEFIDGINRAKEPGAKELDLKAHVDYIKQLGWIFGYNRKDPVPAPSVAVQINNNTGSPKELDAGTVAELARLVEAEIRNREPDRVHEADSGIIDAESCSGVGESPKPIQPPSGGGGA